MVSVHVKNAVFSDRTTIFTFHGVATCENCTFGKRVTLSFLRNQFESTPSDEQIQTVLQNSKDYEITFNACDVKSNRLSVHFIEVVRVLALRMVNCNTSQSDNMNIYIGNETETKCFLCAFAKITVENSNVANVLFYAFSGSIGFVQIRKTVVQGWIASATSSGSITFKIVQCTFPDIHWGAVYLIPAIHVSIIDSTFVLREAAGCQYGQGCAVNVKGLTYAPVHYKLINQLLLGCNSSWQSCKQLHIENSIFVGSAGGQGGVISCEDMSMELIDCTFSLTAKHNPANVGGFIYCSSFWGTSSFRNLTLDVSALHAATSVSILVIYSESVILRNVEIKCPIPLSVGENAQKMSDYVVKHHFLCKQHCKSDEYSFQAGSMILEGNSTDPKFANVTKHQILPKCLPCPIGANCSQHILALPNYWGYKLGQSDVVGMIRCPHGYCCQNDQTCKDIDSCNENRTGPLCGRCKENRTLPLFSSQCSFIDECPTKMVLALYCLCVVVYAFGFVLFNYIKDVGPIMFLKQCGSVCRIQCLSLQKTSAENSHKSTCKMPITHNKDTNQSSQRESPNQQLGTEPHQDDSNPMKYVQTLFYYVQDATLFLVYVPVHEKQTESFVVKILQFSPEIIVTLYTGISELCLGSNTNAVTKLLLSSLFGPCVMSLIFIIYIYQNVASIFYNPSWRLHRARLLQTVLLIMQFSHQKVVIGAFSLVQCVTIGDKKILYVQGDIECYTWWQRVTEAYILTCIIPTFIVLSYAPFLVEEKKMSVRTFLLACFFPLPIMAMYHIFSFTQQKHCQSNRSSKNVEPCSSDYITAPNQKYIQTQKELMDIEKIVDESFITDSETDVGSEYSTDFVKSTAVDLQEDTAPRQEEADNRSKLWSQSSREAITSTLLKNFRTFRVLGVQFTWLGVHNLYRIGLIACATYITNPLTRLSLLSSMLLMMLIAHVLIRPYKTNTANFVAFLSFVANACIAMINLWKAALVLYDCKTNCESHRDIALWYMSQIETVLLSYIPTVAIPVTLLVMAVHKLRKKKKEE